MCKVPQIGGVGFLDLFLVEAGGVDGSFLQALTMIADLSTRGLTVTDTSTELGYGLGVHRVTQGGQTVNVYEGALS